MPTITVFDKLQCAAREVEYRKHVYPRLVASKKMTQARADRELAVMESIVSDYKRSSQLNEPQTEMFSSNAVE